MENENIFFYFHYSRVIIVDCNWRLYFERFIIRLSFKEQKHPLKNVFILSEKYETFWKMPVKELIFTKDGF